MKQKMVLIIAVALGLLAFVLTHLYLKAERTKLYQGARKIVLMVAREDLPAGTVLSSQNTTNMEFFEAGVSRTAFRSDQSRVVLGKTLRFPLRRNTPIDWMHVGANLEELTGLAPTIRAGMRAISIPVSGETAVSGLVRPNDKVDILGTFTFNSKTVPGDTETVTFTVLQDVTVLATGQETARAELEISNSRRRGSYSAVTIAVFPQEAELLAFAMNVKGTLTLALRNPSDISVMGQTPPIDFDALQRDLPRLNQLRQEKLKDPNQVKMVER